VLELDCSRRLTRLSTHSTLPAGSSGVCIRPEAPARSQPCYGSHTVKQERGPRHGVIVRAGFVPESREKHE
jgi:hypothetical protein